MSALLTLAKSLGIDPGPLNKADLQEQTCSAALNEIQRQARIMHMTRRLWLAGMDTRNYFIMLADKVMAEKEALGQGGNELAALASLKAQWQAEAVQSILEECEHWSLMGTWGILVEDISEKLEWLCQRAQEAGDENNE